MTVHVHPETDAVDHVLADDRCICGPAVEYVDPDLGIAYPDGPVVVHHALADAPGPWLTTLELGIDAP